MSLSSKVKSGWNGLVRTLIGTKVYPWQNTLPEPVQHTIESMGDVSYEVWKVDDHGKELFTKGLLPGERAFDDIMSSVIWHFPQKREYKMQIRERNGKHFVQVGIYVEDHTRLYCHAYLCEISQKKPGKIPKYAPLIEHEMN